MKTGGAVLNCLADPFWPPGCMFDSSALTVKTLIYTASSLLFYTRVRNQRSTPNEAMSRNGQTRSHRPDTTCSFFFFFFNQARQTSVQCSNYLMKFFLLSYAAVHWLHLSFYFIMVTHRFGQIWSNTQSILDAKKVGDLCSIALNPSAKITVKKG